jgi:hypothetical protein
MATGSPDWWARSKSAVDIIAQSFGNLQVDVVAQTLAELINRPKYGGAGAAGATYLNIPNGVTTLTTTTGKGILYGGYIHTYGCVVDSKRDKPYLAVDSAYISTLSYEELLDYNMTRGGSQVCHLVNYDLVTPGFTVAFTSNITFESSIIVQYREVGGNAPDVDSYLVYAIV